MLANPYAFSPAPLTRYESLSNEYALTLVELARSGEAEKVDADAVTEQEPRALEVRLGPPWSGLTRLPTRMTIAEHTNLRGWMSAVVRRHDERLRRADERA